MCVFLHRPVYPVHIARARVEVDAKEVFGSTFDGSACFSCLRHCLILNFCDSRTHIHQLLAIPAQKAEPHAARKC